MSVWAWVLVWTLLVVGAAAGAFVVLRSLWRKAVALGHELARASELSQRLADRADELATAARERHPVPPPALLRDRDEIRAELAAVRTVRDARADARRAGRHETWARWLEHWQ